MGVIQQNKNLVGLPSVCDQIWQKKSLAKHRNDFTWIIYVLLFLVFV